MPVTRTFEYEVFDAAGKRGKGTIEATNETAAAQALRSQGAVPLSITLSRTGAFVETSRPAMADIAFAASPSIEPTATLSVTGRV